MDLPTLDPGSDLCDYIDSADEGLTRPERFSARIRENCKEETNQFVDKETKEIPSDGLILPEIARPRSMSLAENINVDKEEPKANRRSHCLRLVRTLRHRSPVPLRSQDIQIKLSSLRQQIWMGVPLNVAESIDKRVNYHHPIPKGPLSWGISNMALTKNKMNNKVLLKGTKKLQFVEYIDTEDNMKEIQNKYKREDTMHSKDSSLRVESQRQNAEQKPRKKKSPLKWQKIVNLNSRVEEMCHRKTSFLTIKADSLKLVTLEVPSKIQTRQHKIESRRKHRKSCATCTVSNGGKISSVTKSQLHLQSHSRSHIQLQPLIVPLCDSFSSENDSIDSRTQRASKKKYKKKKQLKKMKSTPATGKKKRVTSANVLRNP